MSDVRIGSAYSLIALGTTVAIVVLWKQHRIIGGLLGFFIVGPAVAGVVTGYSPWDAFADGATSPAFREDGL